METHDKARRLARLIVSEIGLYNPWWDPKGKNTGFVVSRLLGSRSEASEHLSWEVERGRQYYNERVSADVRDSSDYYQEAVVSILGGGDPGTLKRVLQASHKKRRAGVLTMITRLLRTARRHVEKRRGSGDPNTRYSLGIAYRDMGRIEEAIAEFELAAKDKTRLFACDDERGVT